MWQAGGLRAERGISAVELAIVVLILAITAVTAVPMFGRMLQDQKSQSATEVVIQTLRTARQNAIATTAVYRVIFEGSPTRIRTICTDNTPTGNSCPPNRPPDSTVQEELGGTSLSASPTEMRFDPKGAVLTGNGTVTITYPDGQTWRVEVNTPGRIRACKGTSACPS